MTEKMTVKSVNWTVLIIAVAAMFCVCASALVLLYTVRPEASNNGSLAALLLSSLATTVAAIGAIVASSKGVQLTDQVDKKADSIGEKVDRVLNGTMDDKIAEAVHKVLDERGLGSR